MSLKYESQTVDLFLPLNVANVLYLDKLPKILKIISFLFDLIYENQKKSSSIALFCIVTVINAVKLEEINEKCLFRFSHIN